MKQINIKLSSQIHSLQIAQLIVAYVIELLGWFGVEKQPFEWRKVIGMLVAIVGVVIFKWER